MASASGKDLLARLAGRSGETDDCSELTALAATAPQVEPCSPKTADGQKTGASARQPASHGTEDKLGELLDRISQLTDAKGAAALPHAVPANEAGRSPSAPARGGSTQRKSPSPAAPANAPTPSQACSAPPITDSEFVPIEPCTLREACLSEVEVEALILKFLHSRGDASGRDTAEQIRLPFGPVADLLQSLKSERLVAIRGDAPMNDYVFQLSEMGMERARRYMDMSSYFGSAPVSLKDYVASVGRQSLVNQHPTAEDLHRAFADLLINKKMLDRLGPAINSGRGLFLYGEPGNGKTSIAERVTSAFGPCIWIPRAVGVDGEIIRVFDPVNHEEVPLPPSSGLLREGKIDQRWVRIRRPTIVVGGELTMDALEVTRNTATGISEAPLQMKSNCGTLVIDDFGRQRMSVDQLLNRWIVPLEKRYDFLNLPNGKKIRVPFDQLIIFSTNLEPKDLVDDAFLRRIPYKIHVQNPSEAEFRELFAIVAKNMGIPCEQRPLDHLIETHYRQAGRPFRCCHPRDLLLQIKNYCSYQKIEPSISVENLDFAVENYFTIMT